MKQNINTHWKYKNIGLQENENPNTFIKYSNSMQDLYKNIEENNGDRKQKY